MRKSLLIAILSTLLILTSTPSLYAQDWQLKDSYNARLEENLATIKDPNQYNSLQRLLELRKQTEKEIMKSLKEADAEAHASQKITSESLITIESTNVSLGIDAWFAYSTEGKYGGSESGTGTYLSTYDLSTNRNLVKATSWGIGTGDGWAWTGRRFYVDGPSGTSQTAYFTVDGYYKAYLNAMGGESLVASYGLDLRLYDATTGQWVGSGNIANEMVNGSADTPTFDLNKSNIFSYSLQAGHEYVVLMLAEAGTNALFSAYCEANSYDTSLNEYSDWYYIEITF